MADELLEDGAQAPEEVEPESAEERARREAALAQIRKLGDPVLRTRALDVSNFDSRLRAEVDWMRGVMDDALGHRPRGHPGRHARARARLPRRAARARRSR